jgi:transcriptional regulator with XRE-family HTH domain
MDRKLHARYYMEKMNFSTKLPICLIILLSHFSVYATDMRTRVAKLENPCAAQLRIAAMENDIRLYMNTFYRIRMRALGSSQAKMAEYLGRTKGAVNHMLSGRTLPSINDLAIMSRVLGLNQQETFPPGWIQSLNSGSTKVNASSQSHLYVNLALLDRVFNIIKPAAADPELQEYLMTFAIDITVNELGNDSSVLDERVLIATLTHLYQRAHGANSVTDNQASRPPS